MEEIGGVKFKHKMPQVLNNLYQYRELIRKLLSNPDEALIQDIEDNWGENESHKICLNKWFELMQQTFNSNEELKDIDLQALFSIWDS